jgi:DNA-binding IclR family transcriptional regulator
MVTPFARALSLLDAFTPQDPWLGTRELAARTDLPLSTVTRIAHSLVLLGYLRHSPAERGYRVAAPVLALGYGAITSCDLQRMARIQMRRFAEDNKVHVTLSSRDRLDVVVLESCGSARTPLALNLLAGMRLPLASSPIGGALLAALPELERCYLLEHVERRELREWPRWRRRSCEAMAQVRQMGFCYSLGQCDGELAVVAAPLFVEGGAPLVMACAIDGGQATRARVEREIGPRLLALANAIRGSETSA